MLAARTDEERDRALTDLLTADAFWRIDRIVDRKFRTTRVSADDREDVRAEVLLRLVNRLRRLTADTREPIASFPDYVAAVAFNTFDDFMRRMFPLRAQLKNRIRYVLGRDPRFAIWLHQGTLLAGLEQWRGHPAASGDDLKSMKIEANEDVGMQLEGILGQAGGPMSVDALVGLVGQCRGLNETGRIAANDGRTHRSDLDALDDAQHLAEVWKEICELPRNQRIALLLGARDESGESITRLLPLTRVATVRQMGEALELGPQRFAQLWPDLPLDDNSIAALLGATRQQVINLRKSARNRLERKRKRAGRR